MDPFLLSVSRVCLCHTILSVPCSLMIACWEGLTSWLYLVCCFLVFYHFPIRCPGSGVVLDCVDS